MATRLRLLHIEDCDDDSLLLRRHLTRAGYDVRLERVESEAALETALDREPWDAIICDYVLPGFGAPAALQVLKRKGIDTPFIILSGAIGEETAVAAMRAGAHDYLMKDNLARLAPAIEREMHEWRTRRERQRAEEALQAAGRLASLGRLAATIAHEINNPLEAVTNLLYLIRHCEIDEEGCKFVRIAEQELERVSQIVHQVLAFCRTNRERPPVRISQLLDEVLHLYARRIEDNKVQIEKVCDADPLVAAEIRQVVCNLIVNAVDAVAPWGKVRLHVFRSHSGQGNGAGREGICLVIADNGVGIRPEQHAEIFEQPFFSTKPITGHGLGLWISKEIVQKYGGSIRVRSSIRPGHSGTVFMVFMPAQAAMAKAVAGAA